MNIPNMLKLHIVIFGSAAMASHPISIWLSRNFERKYRQFCFGSLDITEQCWCVKCSYWSIWFLAWFLYILEAGKHRQDHTCCLDVGRQQQCPVSTEPVQNHLSVKGHTNQTLLEEATFTSGFAFFDASKGSGNSDLYWIPEDVEVVKLFYLWSEAQWHF